MPLIHILENHNIYVYDLLWLTYIFTCIMSFDLQQPCEVEKTDIICIL